MATRKTDPPTENSTDVNDDTPNLPAGKLSSEEGAVSLQRQAAQAEELVATVGRGLGEAMARRPGEVAEAAPDLVTELNNIDFRKMIGGPLQAAVDAQVASSLASVDFINKVGFTAPGADGKRELVMVDFTHTRKDVNDAGTEVPKEIHIKVPLLAMVQIPSLRIEHVLIAFNAKLNSVETRSVSDKLGIDVSVGGGFGPVNFKVSASYQRQSASGLEVKKEYSLNVNVKAVQDEIPAGLEKILGMLAA